MAETLAPDHLDADALLRALVEGGVEFVLIGGLAVGMHGAVRATRDVDIVPDPAPGNLERLATVVVALEGRQIGVDTEFVPHQPDAAELAAAALETVYEGLLIRYCSREHLIAMKRAARRPLDLRDLDELGAGE